MSRDSVISKIKKLLALSTSSNEHEAAAAAARAAELMREHEIEEAQLRVAEPSAPKEAIEQTDIDSVSRTRVQWKGQLAQAIAKSCGCHMWWHGSATRILGRQSATRTVAYLYGYLVNEVERLSHEVYKQRAIKLPAAQAVAWKNAFRTGATQVIANRLYAGQKEHEASANRKLAAGDATSAALVLVRQDQAEVDSAWKRVENGLTKGRAARISNTDGYHAGRAAGATIALGGGRGLGAAPSKLRGGS